MPRDATAHHDQIIEDRHLAHRLLDGDEAAFECFAADYLERVYRFALRRLDHDDILTQEIAQSTIVKTIEKLDTYRGEATLFSWICSICRSEISAHFRKLRREPLIETVDERPDLRTVVESLADEGAGPEGDLDRQESVRLVHHALDGLPARYGRALQWKYLDGLSVKEIADRLEVSSKAAESILTRARDAFRETFEKLGRPGGLRLVPTKRVS
jgi:RNA polymerase sigma-70 factor (ECF subfamily)